MDRYGLGDRGLADTASIIDPQSWPALQGRPDGASSDPPALSGRPDGASSDPPASELRFAVTESAVDDAGVDEPTVRRSWNRRTDRGPPPGPMG